MSGLEERKWAHSQSRQASGSRVAGHIVSGYCRTRQDELSRRSSVIHRPSDMIPDVRLRLPLIDESWRLAAEHRIRVDANHAPGVPVNVKEYLAGGEVPAGGRFPARLGTLHYNRTGSGQSFGEFSVDNSGTVVHGKSHRGTGWIGQ